MTATTTPATGEKATVTCPDCRNVISTEVTFRIEPVEHNPDGVIDATCGRCEANFAVGFRRKPD